MAKKFSKLLLSFIRYNKNCCGKDIFSVLDDQEMNSLEAEILSIGDHKVHDPVGAKVIDISGNEF